MLCSAQQAQLTAYRDQLNPAELARHTTNEQNMLIKLAKDKTDQFRAATVRRLPDTARGLRLRATS